MAPPKRPAASGTPKRRGRPKKARVEEEEDQDAPGPSEYTFGNSLNLDDIPLLPKVAWEPATDEEIHEAELKWDRYKVNAKQARVRGLNYDIQDLSGFPNLHLDWWDHNWAYEQAPDRELSQDETITTVKKIQNSAGIRGQTIAHTTSATNPGNELAASMLGFPNLAAYYTWLDTQGTRFFADLEQLKLNDWQPRTSKVDFTTLPALLNERSTHGGVHRVLKAVSVMESHRTFYVRNGDVDSAFAPIRARPHTHIGATMLANVLAALMFSTTGPDTEERRFKRVEGEGGDKGSYHYGYHADDWLAMIQGGVISFHYRRKPDSSFCIDRKPNGHISGVPRLIIDEMTGIVAQADKLEESNALDDNMEYLNLLSQFKPADEPADTPTTDEFDTPLQKLEKRMTNRLEYICSAPRRTNAFRAKAVSRQKGKGTSLGKDKKAELSAMPPISQRMLDVVLDSVKKNHGTPQAYVKDEESAEALQNLISKTDGSIDSFLASQEELAEKLAATLEDSEGLTRAEARVRIRKLIKQSWTAGQMSSQTPPEEVDFKVVLEAFGFDPTKPQRKNLKLNPKGNDQFTAMEHQLVDAYLLWLAEKSVIRGSILANEVGTGKTVTAIASMLLDYRHLCAAKERGEPIEAYPSLMVVPAGLVGQTFNEVTKFFGGLIDISCHYGKPGDYTGLRQAKTLSRAQWEEEMHQVMDRKVVTNEPKNALKLYLTSYTTAMIRFFKRYTTHDMTVVDHVDHVERGDTIYDPEAEASAEQEAIEAEQRARMGDADEDEEAEEDTEMDNSEEKTKSTHTFFRLRFCGVAGAKFNRIIMDEAHALRNPKSAVSRMMRIFPRKATLLMTATPTLNRLSDIYGLLNQIYQFSQLNMSGQADDSEMLDDEFDFTKVTNAYEEDDTKPLLSLFDNGTAQEDIEAVRQYVEKTGKKPWAILPQFSSRIASDADSSSRNSDATYKAAIQCVQLRRTMRDAVKVMVPSTTEEGVEIEGEELKFPGQSIPPSQVITKELFFKGITSKEEDKHLMHNYTNHLASQLNNVSPESDDVLPDTGDAPQGSMERMNMAIHRMLLLGAFDSRSIEVFCKEDNVSNYLEAAQLRMSKKHEKTVGSYNGHKPTNAGQKKGKSKAAQKAAPVVMGVEQVEKLRDSEPTGGLLYLYTLVDYPKTGCPAPMTRTGMIQWALARSPVLTEIVSMVSENMKQEKRTLIMVDNQYCQQQVVAILEMIGYEVGSIRASDSAKHREGVVDQFNSKDSKMAAFVLNASTSMWGLNLHYCCSEGIIAQFTWNIARLIQMMGRISRVGQKEQVTWTILRVNGSYYDIQENKMCQKFAEVLRNEGHMPAYLTSPTLQRIVAYEQIRVMLSQPFNRYSWAAPGIDPPGPIQEYNDIRHRRLGQFFTALARMLMVLPEELQVKVNELAYCMNRLASEFEKLDMSHHCYQAPSMEWVKEMLAKCASSAKAEILASVTPDAKRSLKYKSAEIIVDSDGEDEEDKELDAEALKTQNTVLSMAMDLDNLRSLEQIGKDSKRTLGETQPVPKEDDNEALEFEKGTVVKTGNGVDMDEDEN